MLLVLVPVAAQHQAHRHTGDGRVDAAVVHQPPDDQGERNVHVPPAYALAQQQPEHGESDDGSTEGGEVDGLGEEDRDDQNREQVVDDGERQQEGAQGGRQRRPDDGEHGEREGDVGGGGHGPSAERATAGDIDERVHERGNGHPAHRRDHRQHRGLRILQIPRDQLALELDPRDEEEHGEQPVGRPVLDGEIEPEGGGPMWKLLTVS